jgi:lipopolysaccharide export LptBFGC system permease protein LptF
MVMVFVSVIILSFFYGLLGRLSNHTVVATPLVLAGLWFAGFLVAAIPFVYLRKYKAKQED